MKISISEEQAKTLLDNKLLNFFGVAPTEAAEEQFYRALALVLVDIMADRRSDFNERAEKSEAKRIYYLSMEFLMGRSLKNNLFNLNLTETFRKILKRYGVSLEKLYEYEPDAGLGNGGLGRLAACYLDAFASQGYNARGYSLLYQFGIFKQKLIDGWQTELPDNWLPGGDVWLSKREESSVYVNFEGTVKEWWDNGVHKIELLEPDRIKAVPYDMFVSGKNGEGVSVLRLWSAQADEFDMSLFNGGQYLKAMERDAMARVICKILYPADDHPEGKSLRIKQQYFLVSASAQDLVRHHLKKYPSLDSLPDKTAIHINDTHPALIIPELMRILLDDYSYGWDAAWRIVTACTAYTNHTVMKEALECWREELIKTLIPRIYQIIKETDNRFRKYVWNMTHDAALVERTAIISGGVIKMANLCVSSCSSVNGVSVLHSQILKDDVFGDYYSLTPEKFTCVTNGIAHRRWLCQANPLLSAFIKKKTGNGFVTNAIKLSKLKAFENDDGALEELGAIKEQNKKSFSDYVYSKSGILLDPSSLFDVQVKRLHEYKRQEMNALRILNRYLEIKDAPNGDYVPHTYIFGAKAAPGYFMAKKIISFIYALANMINSDKAVNKYMKIMYIENYCVSAAERLMPAADFSEQISLAGTEASGTGNMKLMINGAITLGTMDGANIEIYEAAGRDNIIIFGMTADEVNALKKSGYEPNRFYLSSPQLKRTVDFLNSHGIDGKSFPEIGETIKHHDPYMVLADYDSYCGAQKTAEDIFRDKKRLNKMSLANIAGAGRFSADRAVKEYAEKIWHTAAAAEK